MSTDVMDENNIAERMFVACFTILGEFVDKKQLPSLGGRPRVYRGYELHSHDEEEVKAIDLWIWYRDELPRTIQDVLAAMPPYPAGEEAEGFVPLGRHLPQYREIPFEYLTAVKDRKLRELMEIRVWFADKVFPPVKVRY